MHVEDANLLMIMMKSDLIVVKALIEAENRVLLFPRKKERIDIYCSVHTLPIVIITIIIHLFLKKEEKKA